MISDAVYEQVVAERDIAVEAGIGFLRDREAAEAERDRLRGALEAIADPRGTGAFTSTHQKEIARAALGAVR